MSDPNTGLLFGQPWPINPFVTTFAPLTTAGNAGLILPSRASSIIPLLPKFNSALQQVRAKARHAVGIVLSDSTAAGYSGTTTPSYAGARATCPVEKMLDTLASYGITVNRQNFMGDNNVTSISGTTVNSYDPRITLGSGWAVSSLGAPGGTFGANVMVSSTAGTALSFACNASVDRCVVFWASNATGTFTVDVGGSALGTFSNAGNLAFNKSSPITLGGSASNYTINFKATTTTPVCIIGMMCWNSADPGVTILNASWSSGKVTNFTHTETAFFVTPSLASLGHDFALISLLINDAGANTASSSFTTDTTTLINAAKAGGSADVILYQGPTSASSTTAFATRDAFLAIYAGLAQSLTVPLIDVYADMGQNTGSNANFVDVTGHLTPAGKTLLGNDLAMRLLNGYVGA